MNYRIRTARAEDAQAVHDIYGAYIPSEHVTFTTENPSVGDYAEKIRHTLEKYPFYVAESDGGEVLGYIYGSPLRPHDAYKWNVESTIVLSPSAPRRQGIATALYKKFEEKLEQQNYKHIYAVIVDSNEASIALHRALGFEKVGHFLDAGFKLGKWRGIVWMQKPLGDPAEEPREPLPFSE